MKVLLFSDVEAMMVRKTSQQSFVNFVDQRTRETTLGITNVGSWYQNESGLNTNNWVSTSADYCHLLSMPDGDDYLCYDEENVCCSMDDHSSQFALVRSVYQRSAHFFQNCRYFALNAVLPPLVALYIRHAAT